MTYKKFAIGLAREAGKIMLRNFKLGMNRQIKADGSPVTKTDFAVNKMVIGRVKKYFSGHNVLGEEESYLMNHGEFVWVCDPVDGTVPFSHGIPTFVFSLALVKNGVPILGAVYDPFMDRMFFAELGRGATLNGKKIRVNKLGMKKGTVVGWTNLEMGHFKKAFPNIAAVCLWCICYEGALVACGELSATFYNHFNAHDIAALKVIVEEAGGKVTDRYGKEQRYDRDINGALISNGVVHKQLLNLIKSY